MGAYDGQIWGTDGYGGFLSFDKLSKQIRHTGQPMQVFRQFTRPEPGIGKKSGDTIFFNRVSNVDTPGTNLSEGAVIPESRLTISRGEGTATEYGLAIPLNCIGAIGVN